MKHTYGVKHSDENIREFLESGVPLDLYCVFQFENDEGLIHSYEVGDGRLWFW